ncbi:MAG: methyltransferase domain-containing protein [Thaumarchaeota archaeon]|nr:methyltransferase domain-containing protein [Nitrososphaerota archaeon]
MVDEATPQTRGITISWARFYDSVMRLWFLGQDEGIRKMTLELIGLHPGDKVLDLGCGTGSLTLLAKSSVGAEGEVHAIDADPVMISLSRHKASKAGLNVSFQKGLIEDIPFLPGSFDVVFSSLTLHHLPDDLKHQGATEILRVLRPGGRFLAVDFEPPNRWISQMATLLHMLSLREHNVRKFSLMMAEVGFKDIEVGTTRYKLLSFVSGRKVRHNSK